MAVTAAQVGQEYVEKIVDDLRTNANDIVAAQAAVDTAQDTLTNAKDALQALKDRRAALLIVQGDFQTAVNNESSGETPHP